MLPSLVGFESSERSGLLPRAALHHNPQCCDGRNPEMQILYLFLVPAVYDAKAFQGPLKMRANFTLADWLVVGAYLVAVSAIGSFFYRRKSSSSDYFLGGRRMRVIP